MITKELVSVKIDWTNDTLEILEEFDPLEDVGVLRTNEDGTKEIDVWISSNIFKNKMRSNVVEFIKPSDNFDWIRKSTASLSDRYKSSEMVLDNSTYCQVERDENGIIIGFAESVDEEHLDSEGNVIEGYYQTFSLFKQYTNIINLMYSTMSKR